MLSNLGQGWAASTLLFFFGPKKNQRFGYNSTSANEFYLEPGHIPVVFLVKIHFVFCNQLDKHKIQTHTHTHTHRHSHTRRTRKNIFKRTRTHLLFYFYIRVRLILYQQRGSFGALKPNIPERCSHSSQAPNFLLDEFF
jgi:hypothetical protein